MAGKTNRLVSKPQTAKANKYNARLVLSLPGLGILGATIAKTATPTNSPMANGVSLPATAIIPNPRNVDTITNRK